MKLSFSLKDVFLRMLLWEREEEGDYIPLRTVYSGFRGSVTTDGVVYQAWLRHSQWYVERVGNLYPTREAAVTALEEAYAASRTAQIPSAE